MADFREIERIEIPRDIGALTFVVITLFPVTYSTVTDSTRYMKTITTIATVPWFIITCIPACLLASYFSKNMSWPLGIVPLAKRALRRSPRNS